MWVFQVASTGKGNTCSHSGSAFDWHHLPSQGVRVRGFNGRRVYVCRFEVDHAACALKEGMHKCGMKIFSLVLVGSDVEKYRECATWVA